MINKILTIRLVCFYFIWLSSFYLAAQSDCNRLGAWVWHVELTAFMDHHRVADRLAAHGVKRVYLKVADGSPNPDKWPELLDKTIIDIYHSEGLEIWAWSYNYRNNAFAQAEAIRLAAATGYDGYVVDVEMEFDGRMNELATLIYAFRSTLDQAKSDGLASDDFRLYCTTWGNPMDHQYAFYLFDQWLDGYMPQTYVEIWGPSYVANLEYWIQAGNQEYKSLGATKPIHHICATQEGKINSDEVNRFIAASGPETSLWVVPGLNTNPDIWSTWLEVDWNKSFCTGLAEIEKPQPIHTIMYEGPLDLGTMFTTRTYDIMGNLLASSTTREVNLDHRVPGLYLIQLQKNNQISWLKVVVN